MENVKVIIWGLGAMGGGMADMLLKKKGVDIVGVAGRGKKIGTSMYDYIKTERGDRPDVIIQAEQDVIKPGAADVVLLCTDSFTKQAFPRIKFILEQGINVITSAEEMAYPKAQEPELAEELDKIAKANGVSVLGTGINPGLIMDLLVLIWTGCMEDVEHIVSRRVNSLSPFGPAVMEEQGIGISKEFLPHIFDPFERENNTTMSGVDGTGLGLTIVKNIVDLMGGSVNVNSVQGRGSRFIVTLNLALPHPAKENPPAKIRAQNLPSRQEPHRLLVVEDNEINLEIEMELLEDAGFRVELTENGSAALERVACSRPGDYALVLMDLQMPVMDGCQAARAIRALPDPLLAGIPIIALSANTFEEDQRMSLESGMNGHLAKPIDIPTLLETIGRILGEQV